MLNMNSINYISVILSVKMSWFATEGNFLLKKVRNVKSPVISYLNTGLTNFGPRP